MFDDIVKLIEQKFDVRVEKEVSSNLLLIRVSGLDNYSLARYITENFNAKVTVKQREGYKFSDFGWIKIQKSDNSELILTT